MALFPEKANHKQKENIGVMSWALTNPREYAPLATPTPPSQRRPSASTLLGGGQQSPAPPPRRGARLGPRAAAAAFRGAARHPARWASSPRCISGRQRSPPLQRTGRPWAVFLPFVRTPLLAERSQTVAKRCKRVLQRGCPSPSGKGGGSRGRGAREPPAGCCTCWGNRQALAIPQPGRASAAQPRRPQPTPPVRGAPTTATLPHRRREFAPPAWGGSGKGGPKRAAGGKRRGRRTGHSRAEPSRARGR